MHKAGATTCIPLLPSNLHIKQLRQRVKKAYSCRKEVLHKIYVARYSSPVSLQTGIYLTLTSSPSEPIWAPTVLVSVNG